MSEPERSDHTERVRDFLDAIGTRASEAIGRAAVLMGTAMAEGGIIHVTGAGHSLAMVCETFHRAGGLVPVRPLWHPALLPFCGGPSSDTAARTPGIGFDMVMETSPHPPNVMVVFSCNGREAFPVDVAVFCERNGVPVIAVTSRQAVAQETEHTGTRLMDHATVVLDTCVPPDDVTYPPEAPRTAAVSTIAAAYLWSHLLVEIDAQAAILGLDIPRWVSAEREGAEEVNQRLLERYGPCIPELL
ncbi:sugar isomerase domain-containing protein [Streptomyces lavendulocolor]|uniref:sugar isomerase domain-containing protein n=1 Tax=Streptomyces lavendulocolor TaxID=67316 RepID=UPI003C2D5DF1